MDAQWNVQEQQDDEMGGGNAERNVNSRSQGTSEMPTSNEEAHISQLQEQPPPPGEVHKYLNVDDAAGGGNASGSPLHDDLAPQDDFQSMLDGAHGAGAALGPPSAQDIAQALRMRYRQHAQERRSEKERKQRECFKEGVAHLRTMVPGLNKKSDPLDVLELTAKWITHVDKYITQANNAVQAAHGPPDQVG